MIVEGTYDEFNKYFGRSLFTNLVKIKTANHKAKRTMTCEGVNDTPPHKVQGEKGKIQFCHPPGESRPKLLYDVLLRHKISAAGAVEVFRCDISILADEFWQAHIPIIPKGKFLCAACKTIYGD